MEANYEERSTCNKQQNILLTVFYSKPSLDQNVRKAWWERKKLMLKWSSSSLLKVSPVIPRQPLKILPCKQRSLHERDLCSQGNIFIIIVVVVFISFWKAHFLYLITVIKLCICVIKSGRMDFMLALITSPQCYSTWVTPPPPPPPAH